MPKSKKIFCFFPPRSSVRLCKQKAFSLYGSINARGMIMPVFFELQILAAFHTSCSDTNELFCLFSHHVPSNRMWHEDAQVLREWRMWISGAGLLIFSRIFWILECRFYVHVQFESYVPKWRDYATYVSRTIHRESRKETNKKNLSPAMWTRSRFHHYIFIFPCHLPFSARDYV